MRKLHYGIRWSVVAILAWLLLVGIFVGRYVSAIAASIIVVGTLVLFTLIALFRRRTHSEGSGIFADSSPFTGVEDPGYDLGDFGGDAGGSGE